MFLSKSAPFSQAEAEHLKKYPEPRISKWNTQKASTKLRKWNTQKRNIQTSKLKHYKTN